MAAENNSAVLYLRISSQERMQQELSLATQERMLRDYCRLKRLRVGKVFTDAGISGTRPLASRPGGKGLVNELAKGEVRHLVALRLDRLFRSAEDSLKTIWKWEARGIGLHLANEGGQPVDATTALGRFLVLLQTGLARFESDTAGERTKAALQFRKSQGRAYSGVVPYGYTVNGRTLKPDGKELAVVKQIKARRKQGWTLERIAEDLNGRQVPTKAGGKWYGSTISYILNNDLYNAL